ncbi:MAG: CDP-diacylglycerol--glycerol-3-phosphate 3-phosphatidyltransferase [Verrucomicrobiota bacterium]
MNLPNLLTLSRIAFLFIIVALLYMPVTGAATGALVLFIFAALTDWLDGYLARKRNQISDFGKLMDALADKILMVGIFVAFLAMPDFLPWWCIFLVLLIIGREFLITGLRLVAASRSAVLAAERGGKVKTVVQIVAAIIFLLTHALVSDFGASGGLEQTLFVLGMISFVLATLLTVQSGVTYMTKYWYLFQNQGGGKAE